MRLRVDAARGRPNGERVLVLIRPESLELEAATNGRGARNAFPGEVADADVPRPGDAREGRGSGTT